MSVGFSKIMDLGLGGAPACMCVCMYVYVCVCVCVCVCLRARVGYQRMPCRASRWSGTEDLGSRCLRDWA